MKVILIFTLILLLINSGNSLATDVNIVTESFPPFITVNKNQISGLITNRVKKIMDISQLSYSLTAYPWARSYQIASSQANTLIFSIIKSPERAPFFYWFCPVYTSSPFFAFKLKGNAAKIDSISELKKVFVGTARHGINHEHLKKLGFEAGKNLDVSATEDINIKKLINGRVDAVVQSAETFDYRLKKLGYENVEVIQGVAINEDKPLIHCLALNINSDPLIRDKITQAFLKYQNTSNSSFP